MASTEQAQKAEEVNRRLKHQLHRMHDRYIAARATADALRNNQPTLVVPPTAPDSGYAFASQPALAASAAPAAPVVITVPAAPVPAASPAPVASPAYAPTDTAPASADQPIRTAKVLKVRNDTDEPLTVYVSRQADDRPICLELQPGEQSAVYDEDGRKVVAARLFVWAKGTSGKRWDNYRDEAFVLVPTSYRAEQVKDLVFPFIN